MKRLLLIFGFACSGLATLAQCGKNVIYHSGKADFIDSLGKSIHSKEGKITVTLTEKDFILMHDDNEEDALRGDVKNLSCEWKDAYKNGKTTFDSELTEKNGDKSNAVVSIEGKDGKVLILMKFTSRDMTLKIIPDSIDEAKK